MPDSRIENLGPGPYDPSMEARVARLEDDMREVKTILGRLEPMIIRMDTVLGTVLPTLATKTELVELRSELRGEITESRSEARGELAEFRSDLRGEMAELRSDLRAQLAEMPSKTYMWGILGVLITAYAAGLAAMAVIR